MKGWKIALPAMLIGVLSSIGSLMLHVSNGTPAQEAKPLPKAPPKRYFGHKNPPEDVVRARHAAAFARHDHRLKALPKATAASFDCRTLGWVPPIKDQGQCGTCWDFSGVGVVESCLIKAGYGKNDGSFNLSEQYALDGCWNNGGCDGDDNVNVLAEAKQTGIPSTADYGAYTASSGRCKYTNQKLWKINDWGYASPNQSSGIADTQSIKNAMVAYGPIGTGIAAGSWGDPGNGVITGNDSGVDHDVILVGWDDTQNGGKGAWIMRNSWGTNWGNGGYAWVAYGADSVGSEACWATATPLPPQPPVVAAPVVTSSTTAVAQVGQPFSYQIVATNSPTSFTASGLPAGLTFFASGQITGTPTAAGTSAIAISATNAGGTGTATLNLTVGTTPVPASNPAVSVMITYLDGSTQTITGGSPITPATTIADLVKMFANKEKR